MFVELLLVPQDERYTHHPVSNHCIDEGIINNTRFHFIRSHIHSVSFSSSAVLYYI